MNISNERIFFRAKMLFALALVLAFSGDAKRAEAQQSAEAQQDVKCNVANLRGTYVFSAFGSIGAANPYGLPPGPYNSAGTLTMDGAGNYTSSGMTSYNGVIKPEEFADRYVVGEHCGVDLLFFGAPFFHVNFTVNRQESHGIATVPGTNVAFLMVKN